MRLEKLLCCLAFLLVLPRVVIYAAAPPKNPPASADKAIDIYLSTESAALEDDLAALMLRRQPAPADQPLLDLQIDCRVIQHWIMEQGKSDDHHDRASLILRQRQLAAAQADLDDWILKTPIALNGIQRLALVKVHKLTFSLNDEKATHTPDEVTHELGNALLSLVGLGDLKEMPILRPKSQNNPADTAPAPAQNPHATVADLATAAKQANVPPALHAQLVALADAALRPPAPKSPAMPADKDESDREKLQKLLRDSVELLNDLASLPVTADVRDKSQSDLADALVLSLDPRTASMGEEKLRSLKQIRQALSGIAASKLSKDLTDALAPLLSWAAANPTLAAPVLKSVRTYLETCDQFDRLSSAAQPALPPALEKTRQLIAATFATTRAKFLTDAASVGGFADTGPAMASEADELQRMVMLTQAINRVPADLPVVAAFKSHSQTTLEKRIATAANDAAGTIKSPLRDQGMHTLDELHRLSTAIAALVAVRTDDLPADVMPKTLDKTPLKLDLRWHAVVLQGIGVLASNGSVDASIYDRLQSMSDLVQLGHALAEARDADAQSTKLAGWVDWNMPSGEIDKLLKPLESDLLDALTAVSTDDWTNADRLARSLTKYRPLLRVLQSTAARADDCPPRPDGLRGDAAVLLTPMDNQPYTAQRMVSMAALLCVQVRAQQALLAPQPVVPAPLTTYVEPQAIEDIRHELLANLQRDAGGDNQ